MGKCHIRGRSGFRRLPDPPGPFDPLPQTFHKVSISLEFQYLPFSPVFTILHIENIKKRGAFTLSIADVDHLEAADFFGIATGNKMTDKFERSGLHAVKSTRVDAPVVEEFPVTLECKVAELQKSQYGFRVLGEIVNVLADEKVLDENGKVDPAKINAFVFDQFQNGYYRIGEKVGQAWKSGAGLMKD
ncbi:MAG TPA: flavin reductase [Candidatus Lachnoclostridium avicola]|nr:flavin reductase [Candidatus Lachnoclostridium avicola]